MRIYIVDAFTDKAFSGNPAAVCILSEPRNEEWMQNVAEEMNLSETAFLTKSGNIYDLRWFTPKIEVDLCGHATLASAHVLWEEGYIGRGKLACFNTRSGFITSEYKDGWIGLNFPALPDQEIPAPPELIEAMKVEPRYVGKNDSFYLIEIESEKAVRKIEPNFIELARITDLGVIVTSASSRREYDFVSRFFAPAVGINEDPVTGSAHCTLGPFWQKRLGRDEFVAFQASKRGGTVGLRVNDDRVYLKGQAITVMRGMLA
ncbi:MAG: PhzF family phenazine biosynthesis protein [Candidatus Saccharibacteria bacterium]